MAEIKSGYRLTFKVYELTKANKKLMVAQGGPSHHFLRGTVLLHKLRYLAGQNNISQIY